MTLEVVERQLSLEFLRHHPQSAVDAFERLSTDEQVQVLESVNSDDLRLIFRRASPETLASASSRLRDFSKLEAATEPSEFAKVLTRMDAEAQKRVMAACSAGYRRQLGATISYPQDSAGRLMDRRVSLFHATDTVNDALAELRRTKIKNLSSVFIVDLQGKVLGRVFLHDLIAGEDTTQMKDLIIETATVSEMAPKEEIVLVVERSKLPSIPVVDAEGGILGVIRHEQLVSMAHEEALDDLQKMVGVSAEEKALSQPLFSVKKRLPWLTINLVTTFIAAFVVGLFEDTIAQITALAVLLPVVAGQSGNTGAQAQAVTMRGLALREIRLRHKWKVLRKEGAVGFVNGLTVGLMCAGSVFIWNQSAALAAVIGVAMVLAMVSASLSGAAIPMVLSALGQDPATSSSIILTTITDIVGFLSFLGLAALFSSYIV